MDLLERILDELAAFTNKSGYRVNLVLGEFLEITRSKESAQIEEIMRGKIQVLKTSSNRNKRAEPGRWSIPYLPCGSEDSKKMQPRYSRWRAVAAHPERMRPDAI
jgi:hypothetical protein